MAHTELIDGSLVVASPQRLVHMKAASLLERGLGWSAPADRYRVRRDMSVVLNVRQRPEPDVIVVHADADISPEGTWYPAGAVVLAVEVVSPDSETRDRERKPVLYGEAGIRYFWRVEVGGGRLLVYSYELDPATHQYWQMGIFHERMKATLPFTMDIDLTEIDRI